MSEAQDVIHAALQTSLHTDSDEVSGNVVTGWAVVAESMAPDGKRWLSRLAGDAGGGTPPEWTVQGWLHNALHDGGWSEDEGEDDD